MKSSTINFDLPRRTDAERFANRFDGGREREAILEATIALQRALRDAGFDGGLREYAR